MISPYLSHHWALKFGAPILLAALVLGINSFRKRGPLEVDARDGAAPTSQLGSRTSYSDGPAA
ncbi:MAG: hypothetical protein ACYC3V_03875 [Chloroflexota bacterium]